MDEFLWVHCNVCLFDFAAAQENNRGPFHITSCGHFVCKSCLRDSGRREGGSCRVCSKPCSIIQLQGQLPPDVESLFADPLTLFNSAIEVVQFQRKQLETLVGKMRALLGKQRETLQQARDELIQMQQLQTYSEELKGRVRELEQQVKQLQAENERAMGKMSHDAPAVDGVPTVLSKLHQQQQRGRPSSASVNLSPFDGSRSQPGSFAGAQPLWRPGGASPASQNRSRNGDPKEMQRPASSSMSNVFPISRKRGKFPGAGGSSGDSSWRN